MTDAGPTPAPAGAAHAATRAAIARRLPGRRRAEWRFRAYGVLAVSLAILALGVLIGSLLGQGFQAFTVHRFAMPIALDAEVLDPSSKRDPEAIAASNGAALVQNLLRAQFPEVRDRTELRELFALSTSLNGVDLARRAAAAPDLVGQTIDFTGPISDDLDLYLKGDVTARLEMAGRGALTISAPLSGEDETLRLASSAADFAAVRADLQDRLEAAAEDLLARAAVLAAAAKEAEDPAIAVARGQDAEALRARAEEYRRQAAAPDDLVLSPETPSVFVRAAGGVVKAIRVGADAIEGVAILPPSAEAAAAGEWSIVELTVPEMDRRVTDRQIVWAEDLRDRGAIVRTFNRELFTRADSREPELAGLAGALVGSLLTMLITMALALPIGVAAAIYLEEFAPKNRWTDLIEVNINNLAAVPSIIFGLLGLAVFLNVFGMPRSAPVVGGLVLALMSLPTIIIASRAALRAVPPSIRSGALGVGASPVQVVFHHVLPLAAPGVMTGSIIALARALGETAPLLMIGMVAFIADVPARFDSPATVMPVQIFLWADTAERAFQSRTAAAILVLLGVMIAMNLLAVILRRRFERRW